MSEQTNKQALSKIIDWYMNLPSGFNGINQLIYARQRLVGYLASFTEQIEVISDALVKAENDLERKKISIRAKYMDEKGIGKATIRSRFSTLQESATVNEGEKKIIAMRDYSKVVLAVLDTMNQHIAILRREEEKSNFL